MKPPKRALLVAGMALAGLVVALAAWRHLPLDAKEADLRPIPTTASQVLEEASEIEGLLGLLAQQDGRMVVEGYFDGTEGDDLLHLRSCTKSVTSLLVGIAIDQELLPSIDMTLGEILGPRVERFGEDKAALTVRHLLTMTAGLEWDESTVDEYNGWRVSREPVAHYLKRPFVAKPGETWSYSSGASHLLSVVLSEVTGGTAFAYARKVLFEPLDIQQVRWEEVAGGHTNGAAGLELRPVDSLKLGELLLGRGAWSGRRIVSEEWIEASTASQVHVGGPTHYGYQWWIDGPDPLVWIALGHGGQVIAAVPESDIVIVANSRWRGLSRPATEQLDEVARFISDRLAPFLVPEYAKSSRPAPGEAH